MDDLISRQAAIDAAENSPCGDTWEVDQVIDAIKRLPSAQPEQRWVSCEERLPDTRDWFLGMFKDSDTEWINPIPFVCEYRGKETNFTTKDYWELYGHTFGHIYYRNLECVAWMPLPESYIQKGEKNE